VTESEISHAGFEILRSSHQADGYSIISDYRNNPDLMGQGNSIIKHEYLYIDRDVSVGQSYWYKLVDVDIQGIHTEHGPISVTLPLIPEEYNLFNNYPNPFNPLTTIEFNLPRSEYVTLNVYSIRGKKITTIVSDKLPSGNYKYKFDGTDLASGVYYYRIEVGDPARRTWEFQDVKKMILIR
jgi:hypothetical protein